MSTFACYLVWWSFMGGEDGSSVATPTGLTPAVVQTAGNRTDGDQAASLPSSSAANLTLTEHVNEEDDYEKPVCKRLEESGDRY